MSNYISKQVVSNIKSSTDFNEKLKFSKQSQISIVHDHIEPKFQVIISLTLLVR